MAILQDIRNKAGIFIMIFVGVALFLFIVDPEVFGYIFDRHDTRIAKIDNQDIEYEEFLEYFHLHEQFVRIAQRISSLDAETTDAVREQAWNDILQNYILSDYFDDVGISVSDYELEDLLYGANIHSIIHQNFTDHQTGRLDTLGVRNFFNRADEDFQSYTIAEYFKTMITKDRLLAKYNNMVAKGFYEPELLAKKDYNDRNTNVNIKYVARRFNNIPDDNITVSEEEIKEYYNSHLYMFQIDQSSRDIEYIVFDVVPSAEDSLMAIEIMEDYYQDFVEADNPVEFAGRYTDFINYKLYYKEDELPEVLRENFFHSDFGTVSEILLTDSSYFAAKIVDMVKRPDSVNASHILLQPNESRSIEASRKLADSLKTVIKDGELFEMLAVTYSDDPGSKQQGGNLGWFTDGMMVPEFNEACFTNKAGDIIKVETQFGVHIIKINEQTKFHDKVKLAVLQKDITWSEQTFNQAFSKASNFSANSLTAKEFDKNAEKYNYIKRLATGIRELDKNIRGLENPREIIRWTYSEDVETGDVSDVFTLGDKFVVTKLTSIKEKGNMPIEDATAQIKPEIIKKKKAEILITEFKNDINKGMSIDAIARKYNIETDSAKTINFNTFSVPGLGIEPNFVATAISLTENEISNPVKGNNGVFVLQVTDKFKAPEKSSYTDDQLNIMRNQAARVGYRTIEALKKKSEIEDFRTRWF